MQLEQIKMDFEDNNVKLNFAKKLNMAGKSK